MEVQSRRLAVFNAMAGLVLAQGSLQPMPTPNGFQPK